MIGNNWLCPFCNSYSVVTKDNLSSSSFYFNDGSKYGRVLLKTKIITCKNNACRESQISTTMYSVTSPPGVGEQFTEISHWNLRPDHTARNFPNYVPPPIREDYVEACKIKDLSPKASATLSRRCLQGIIRDFWGIKKGRLIDEVFALKDKIDPDTWDAINALREIGNIAAHMEKDINTIVEVDREEASHLISLIELLIEDSYIARHKRKAQLAKVVEIAAGKKDDFPT